MLNALLLAVAVTAAPAPLTTVAEQSGYLRTGRYDEVQTLCDAFQKRYTGRVKCQQFGTTPLGRPMLALVASADGLFTPEQNEKKNRPVVLIQGGIHAGEIDGKDAGFWLLRELLEGTLLPKALSRVTLVFVPVFNVDGHERFGPHNRPNQIGPEQMGWRVTAQNYNLNRDYAKADAPEMVAMLQLLQQFMPVMYVDLHVTDGAKFQHDVSVTFEPWATGPENLRALGKSLKVSLFAELESKGHLPVGFYPSFNDDEDPKSGFSYGWPPPRFSNAYWAAHNRFGMLVETHSWKDYKTRVKAHFDVCASLIRQASEDGDRWLKAARDADADDVKRSGDRVLLYRPGKESKPLDFLGYAYAIEKSSVSGKNWLRYDDSKPQVWHVPYFDDLQPSLSVTLPAGGYLVPAQHAAWVAEKLKAHGIRFTVLKKAVTAAPVQQFLVQPKFRPTPYEGHLTLEAQGAWAPVAADVPVGSLFVPQHQPRNAMVSFLFEPSSPESLLAWGFFNAHLEQKEYMEDYVTEEVAREQLKDPKVKAAFDEALKDEKFAKDPEARLRFFAMRHPSYDRAAFVYPVLKSDVGY